MRLWDLSKMLQDFEILPKFSETHVFWGTICHPLQFKSTVYILPLAHSLQSAVCILHLTNWNIMKITLYNH